MEIMLLLLNHYDEDLINKFFINYRTDDPDACLGHKVSIGAWLDSNMK